LKEKLLSYIKIIRPINFLITFFSAVVASIICVEGSLPMIKVILASVAAGLTASTGNIINDIFDIEIDKFNRPERPLPSEKISRNEAFTIYFIFIILSLILSWFVNVQAFLIVAVTTLLLFLYSKYLKKIPLAGNFLVAFLTGLVFIYGGVVVENPTAAIIPALFAFLINLIREIVKDMEDVEGDKKAGVITFPIKFGFQKSKILVLLFTYTLIPYTLYPFLTQLYKIEYFVIVMIVVNPILVYCSKNFFGKSIPSGEEYSLRSLKKISNLLKLDMVFGLIAIYLGT
jgi:geranylgeranylglycerol-phosphate geranylgeranyltransferase